MNFLKNKYFAACFVFAGFQWFAYSAFTGVELTESERSRSKANAVDKLIGWLTENLGNTPSAILLAVLGVVLGYVAYRRMERLSRS